MTQINGKIHHAHERMEESILLKCSYNPKQSTDSMQSWSNTNGTFHRSRTNNPKICMEPQKTLNSQNNLDKEEQNQRYPGPLISNHTTKL